MKRLKFIHCKGIKTTKTEILEMLQDHTLQKLLLFSDHFSFTSE